MFTIYEKIKSFYSEQLFIWGLSSQRLCVLKASSCQESQKDQEEHDNLKVAKSQMFFFSILFHLKFSSPNHPKNCPQKIAPEKPNKLSKML